MNQDAPSFDPETGEILDKMESQPIPRLMQFTHLLPLLRGGAVTSEMSEEIARVVNRVQNQEGSGKPKVGTVTLKLTIAKHSSQRSTADAVLILAEVSSKAPEDPEPTDFFFLTEDGALSQEHPNQQDAFGGHNKR